MSYTNNPTAILAGTGITVTPTTGTGANTITGGAGADTFITGTTGNNIILFGDGANAKFGT